MINIKKLKPLKSNFPAMIAEKAKQKCIPKKYTFKYQTPTFKEKKRDLVNLI
jgi:hypothetical protein